jgi:hypothetical protein
VEGLEFERDVPDVIMLNRRSVPSWGASFDPRGVRICGARWTPPITLYRCRGYGSGRRLRPCDVAGRAVSLMNYRESWQRDTAA